MSVLLVTGGAGFIGSHLCERLVELGHTVVNVDNFNDFYDPHIKKNNILKVQCGNYFLVEGDIRDQELLAKVAEGFEIDYIIHLAALAGVRKSVENPIEYIDVDVKGTVNLLEFCRKSKVKKFIYASSSSVYGTSKLPFNEDACIISQTSPYAASKYSAELFCRTYNLLYNIPIVCLRFFTVYGPRQRPEMAIHNFTRLIDEGKEIPIFGNGTNYRDYTYIVDIIDGIIATIDLKCSFEIINLGNSKTVKLNNLINLIEDKLGKMAYKRYLPLQKGDLEYTYADISKARKMLGYEPKVDIEEGIERFVRWYKDRSGK